MNPRVLIIQEHLPHYRIGFYRSLKTRLSNLGVDLELVFCPRTAPNILRGQLEWALPAPIRWYGKIAWQPVLNRAWGADLVIVQQETKYLATLPLLLFAMFGRMKIAMWGHGRNFQSRSPNSISERFKSFLSRRVDWWFAYNDLSARVIEGLGYPPGRITTVMNSIDTASIRAEAARHGAPELERFKETLGIRSENIAVYTGGLYHDKRIPFLLEACRKVRAAAPDFHLIVIGKGPDESLIREAAEREEWIHFPGSRNDLEKVPYWLVSKVALMPGAVGLGVIDSFALGVPMITTAYPYHGPEIDYLVHGSNGIVVADWESPAAYADAVIGLLRDEERRRIMASEASASVSRYSSEQMAHRFAEGVMRALGADGARERASHHGTDH